MSINKSLPGVGENILLKNYTTFKIGGRARYFFVAKNQKDLVRAAGAAKKFKLPFFVLAGGSNLLVSDQGYKGLVIKMKNEKFKIKNSKIVAEAGTILGTLLNATMNKGLTGLEWAAGIPGQVGGAVWGNAGAFGKSMKDVVREVEVFDAKTSKIKNFKNKDCRFHYRDSIFKKKKNLIVLSATLQLKKGNKKEIQEKIQGCFRHKKTTQPLSFPSAGSIFKNPSGFFAGQLSEEDKSSSSVFAAARLIEECGLKGKRIGNVKISDLHGNFIVNLGGGKARDVKKLIDLARKKVKNKFGIMLREEIQYLGF